MQAVADRIIIIHKGRIVADGTPDELEHGDGDGQQRLTVCMEGKPEEIMNSVKQIPGVLDVRDFGQKEPGVHEYEIDGQAAADIRRPLFGIAAKRDWPILSTVSSELSREDVFLRLTGSTYLSDNADQKFGKDGDRK